MAQEDDLDPTPLEHKHEGISFSSTFSEAKYACDSQCRFYLQSIKNLEKRLYSITT